MSKPPVTVLLTVYNGMPYLKEAVKSILGQTCRDFTFLILNNGSEDGTRSYLDALEDDRLHIVHLPKNIGRTAVLNKGLAMVETELTAIIDADDLAAPTRLEKQCAFLHAHPDIALVGCDVRYIDRGGNAVGSDRFPAEHEALRDRLPLHNQFSHAACTFRTGAALRAGGYPPAFPYAQDFALWIAMFQNGYKAASIQETLAEIRVHPGQTTRDLRLILVRCEDNHQLAQGMLGIPNLAGTSRQAARFRSAGALLRLGRRKEAVREFWQGVMEAPFLLPVNPLLWQRVCLEIRRRVAPMRV